MSITLTAKDLDLLETLTLRLRVMSLRQIRELWWPEASSLHAARRRLARLQWYGFVRMCEVQACPTLPVSMPLMTWSPGEPTPDFEVLSERASSRWTQPAVTMTVCIATEGTGNLMGCRAGRLSSDEHLDRDLRLASVYVHWRQSNDHRAPDWTNKRSFPADSFSPHSADVILRNSMHKNYGAIDAAGRWSARHWQNLHADCLNRSLQYEVW